MIVSVKTQKFGVKGLETQPTNSTQNMPQFKIGVETHAARVLKVQLQKTLTADWILPSL